MSEDISAVEGHKSTLPSPPLAELDPVVDNYHGIEVVDPYRWLEDQDSLRTRAWIDGQKRYARAFLENIPGRERICERIREFLTIETYDSLQRIGNRYFFRKRLPGQEQPCIYMREGPGGEDQLLLDPATRWTGNYTSVMPLRVSPDGRLLLYEVKQGGEQTSRYELLDLETLETLPDILSRGYLRGFVFAPDGNSFYYVHETAASKRPFYRAVYRHILGSESNTDEEIFCAGEEQGLGLGLVSDGERLGFLVYRLAERVYTDFYLKPLHREGAPTPILKGADYSFGPFLLKDRILAITDRGAPNFRVVDLQLNDGEEPSWRDIIPENEARINGCIVARNHIFVVYIRQTRTEINIFDFSGKKLGEIPIHEAETVRIISGSPDDSEVLLEAESFTEPISIFRYSAESNERTVWAKRRVPFDPLQYNQTQVCYASKDGTRIPMFLVGQRDILAGGTHPTIMTSYGGWGISMTPQFSVFVAFLLEHGCLFALPNIRGGSEFGIEWHKAAKRRKRQTAFDDFLSAAEWLIQTKRSTPDKFAIFGGSNSGLLVAAALTQRPELFRAVICMVPLLDMLRYHLFDSAHLWRDEFGTAEDPDDFDVLMKYSPYHNVRSGVAYPATMMISGDADGRCNPLHARKMVARLQAESISGHPILLDYSRLRGHTPVLPLSERIKGLTDRLAFLCDQLQLKV